MMSFFYRDRVRYRPRGWARGGRIARRLSASAPVPVAAARLRPCARRRQQADQHGQAETVQPFRHFSFASRSKPPARYRGRVWTSAYCLGGP